MFDKINIVGLGAAGCAIAEEFRKWDLYQIYKLDKVVSQSEHYFQMPLFQKPEKYEQINIDFGDFFDEIRKKKSEVIFIVGGGGVISNASLIVLEQLKSCSVQVVYIKPDVEFLSQKGALLHNLVYNVFQQYARSGVFSDLLIIDNLEIEELLENISIKDYYNCINEIIVYSIHMNNFFKNSQTVFGNLSEPFNAARIGTLGKIDLNTGEENLFFSLDKVQEKSYYYAVNKEDLKNNQNLLKEIKKHMRQKLEPALKVSFGIYETKEQSNFGTCLARSAYKQK